MNSLVTSPIIACMVYIITGCGGADDKINDIDSEDTTVLAAPKLSIQTRRLVTGYGYTLALRRNGTVVTWGDLMEGGASKPLEDSTASIITGLKKVSSITTSFGGLGGNHSLSLGADGTVTGWGRNGYYGALDINSVADGRIIVNKPIELKEMGPAIDIEACGALASFALRQNGTVWMTPGSRPPSFSGTPGSIKISGLKTVVSLGKPRGSSVRGDGQECKFPAILKDGTVRIIYVGKSELALRVKIANPYQRLSKLKKIVCNTYDDFAELQWCIALAKDGKVRTWGSNDGGQLGDGTTVGGRTLPVVLQGLPNIIDADIGDGGGILLAANKRVYTWAGNPGHGQFVEVKVPTAVPGLTRVVAISGSQSHTCVIKSDQTVWCWGLNDHSEVGDGTSGSGERRYAPVRVLGLKL